MDIPSTPPEPASARTEVVKGIVVSLIAGIVVFVAVIGFITLLNTSSTLDVVQHAQQNHASTLTAIDRIAKNLAKGDTTVGRILTEAGQAVAAIDSSLAKVEQNEYAVCLAVHAAGCIAPG